MTRTFLFYISPNPATDRTPIPVEDGHLHIRVEECKDGDLDVALDQAEPRDDESVMNAHEFVMSMGNEREGQMANKHRGELTDDGTLDTVISCPECGEEARYTLDGADGSYDDFVKWAIDDFDSEHECDETLGDA